MLATLATLAHGVLWHLPLSSPGILVAPSTQRRLVLTLATSALLAPSHADEQRQSQLPCVTIHVYDPADHFHTVYTANQAHPGVASDQPHLVYGDSASEAVLFHLVYGAAHRGPDASEFQGSHMTQTSQASPAALGDPPTQLADGLVPTDELPPDNTPTSPLAHSPLAHTSNSLSPTYVLPSDDTPAYTSFLCSLLTQLLDGTDSEAGDSLVLSDQTPDIGEPGPYDSPTFGDQPPIQPTPTPPPTSRILASEASTLRIPPPRLRMTEVPLQVSAAARAPATVISTVMPTTIVTPVTPPTATTTPS